MASITLSRREFARRSGCDEKQVRRAISYGKLKLSSSGGLDAAQLDLPWRKTVPRRFPALFVARKHKPPTAAIKEEALTPAEFADRAECDEALVFYAIGCGKLVLTKDSLLYAWQLNTAWERNSRTTAGYRAAKKIWRYRNGYISNAHDGYIKTLLCRNSVLKFRHIPDELVQLKRAQIQIKRKLKELK